MTTAESQDDLAAILRHRRLLSWAWGGLVGLGTAGAAVTVWLWATAAGSGAHKATTAGQIRALQTDQRRADLDRSALAARIRLVEHTQAEIRVEMRYTNQALDRLMQRLDVTPPPTPKGRRRR